MSTTSGYDRLPTQHRIVHTSAAAPDALAQRVASAITPVLGVPYIVVGGIAVGRYLPGRTTSDIDILIRQTDFAQATRNLTTAGNRVHDALTIGGTSWTLPDGTNLDVLMSTAAWAKHALTAPRVWHGVRLIDLPYLIVMKLAAGRARDELDIAGMLAHASDDALNAVRRVVAVELPERAQDVESYLFIGRAECSGP